MMGEEFEGCRDRAGASHVLRVGKRVIDEGSHPPRPGRRRPADDVCPGTELEAADESTSLGDAVLDELRGDS